MFFRSPCICLVAFIMATSGIALAEDPRPIDAPDYQPKSFQPRKALENYYGLPAANGEEMTAKMMQDLKPAERTRLLAFSNFPEDVRRRQLEQVYAARQREAEQFARAKGGGKTL